MCEHAGRGKPQACVWRSEGNSGFCSFLTLVWTVNGTRVMSGYVICHVSYVQNKIQVYLHFNHFVYILEECLRKRCHIVWAQCHMMFDQPEFCRNPEFPMSITKPHMQFSIMKKGLSLSWPSRGGSLTFVLPVALSALSLKTLPLRAGWINHPCARQRTAVVRNENGMPIEDDIIRNLLSGFLVCAFNVAPVKKTAPHQASFCAVNTFLIRPITALMGLEEIKHLGDSSSATLIELKWCC